MEISSKLDSEIEETAKRMKDASPGCCCPRLVIGVDCISVYRVLCIYFCNPNVRIHTKFLKITLVLICLCFVGIENISKQRNG